MNTKLGRVITVILTLSLSLFLISAAVKATLAFRQLYYFDLDHLNIANDYGMSKEEIIKNYNILIDYTQKKSISKLVMPSFPMSKAGEIHFEEVKNLFMKFNLLLYITGFISLLGVPLLLRNKSFSFLKWSAAGLLAIPLTLSIPFAVNFDKSFTIFHKIFFNNDYWEFDPVTDPIINVLPQEFFMHCAIMILLILALLSIILYSFYRRYRKV